MRQLILGTTNKGKVREIESVLQGTDIQVRTIAEFTVIPAVEDGVTLEENACKKARHYAKVTGQVALADDSGLEVDFLQGQPGVYSARYAGSDATDADNNEKLLTTLRDIPIEQRSARFRCVLAVATPEGVCETVEGVCNGSIGYAPRGDGGFGYDPLFLLPDGRTMAELSVEEKNQLSHRGQALQRLKGVLGKL